MFTKSIIFTLLALGNGVRGALYATSPVSSTVCKGGAACTIAWEDDGTSPSSSEMGSTVVALYVGSTTVQTLVQTFGTFDPSQITSVAPAIDPTVGPDGDFYFVRFQSVSAVGTDGQPLEAFSAKFTLSDMTGTLNAVESSEIYATASINSVASVVANATIATTSASTSSVTQTSSSGISVSSTLSSTSSASKASTSAAGDESSGVAGSVKLGMGAVAGLAGALFWLLA